MYEIALTQSHFPAQNDSPIEHQTVGGILIAAAQARPDKPFLEEALPDGSVARRWTNAELLRDAERLASALASRFRPGERVAIWAPNIPEWVIFEFAAAMAGLTLVTVNPAFRAKELRYVLEQSRSVGLFLVREHRGNPLAEIADDVCASLPAIRTIVDLENRDALFACESTTPALPPVDTDDAVQIQYTSGTTGFPKGAVLHHRGIVNNARLTMARIGAGADDSYLGIMPMFHTAGCVLSVLGSLQTGCRLVLLRQFDPDWANATVERQRITFFCGVPTMLTAMLESLARHKRDFSSIRAAFSGGSVVPPELNRRVQQRFGVPVEIIYGQTETSPVLTQTARHDAEDDRLFSLGQPLPQTEISLRDVGTNAVVPVGAVGEICARGYCVMLGYNDNPEATARTIDAEGWLHTGDLGTMDARGYVRITGRVKEMIIRGGENLFPVEIENVMLEHPAIAEVAVVGVPDDKWGEIPVCFFRAEKGHVPSRADLVAHCRRDLAAPKTPAHWVPIEAFPLTGSGKIQKFVLRDRYLAGEFPHVLE
jgi:fatty-acyl-CoA synthase